MGTDWEMAGVGRVRRFDSLANRIVPKDARIKKVAGGFAFAEGPIWLPDGTLAFSDIPANRIYRCTEGGEVTILVEPSGFYGSAERDPPGSQPGANGLTLDLHGRLIACEHGNRRLTARDAGEGVTVLADRFEGKRLNSPNDVVIHRDGAIFFTDPPYGLKDREQDPRRELDYSAVFCFHQGKLNPIYKDLKRPNGVTLSPDGQFLYVGNSDSVRRVWLRFPYLGGGHVGKPEVFADLTHETADGNPDGMKVDCEGNVYCTGPGGIWVFSPSGAIAALLEFPELPSNCHWGGIDARTLFVTARTSVYSIDLSIQGIRPLEWLAGSH